MTSYQLPRGADPVWWQRGIIYQIYPRSFQDTNQDGIGDLAGIERRLDYLGELGIEAIWVSPIFPSPMADFGYDVSDYTDIHPIFGDLAAFDRLLAAAHRRGLRLILDFVANHTSDQHPWFRESRAARENPKRDWYIWRDPRRDGGPPNNWISEFGGSAWTFDSPSGQYYYHAFLREQPDLNWGNPEVFAAMLDVMRFWLDRGVDGFRVDAVHHLFEAASLADNPPNPLWNKGDSPARSLLRRHSLDQPETHLAVQAMRAVTDSYGSDRVLIGEASLPIREMMAYYGVSAPGFQLPFNFHLIKSAWQPDVIARLIAEYEAALPPGGWPNWVLGNHDRPRVATRIGPRQARVAAMLLLTLRGTPTIYQGEELGMADVPIASEQVQDPWEKNVPGLGLGRDPQRTPMQWDTGAYAGFSDAPPWLPLARDYARVNVDAQSRDKGSMLSLYRALIALRRTEAALAVGTVENPAAAGPVLAYRRSLAGRHLTIALNFARDRQEVALPGVRGTVLLSTHLDRTDTAADQHVTLRGDEGVVIAETG